MPHQPQHDVQLRADVRKRYELAFLLPENPAFDVAEARITPAYIIVGASMAALG